MCIVFINSCAESRYKYVILSNRDESFQRPTLRSSFWAPNSPVVPPTADNESSTASSSISQLTSQPEETQQGQTTLQILGGRDGIRGGTWLAVATNGRFAVVTNYQEPREPDLVEVKDGRVRAPSLVPGVKSRGDLPTNFLAGTTTPEEYLSLVRAEKDDYPGFNLIVGDCTSMSLFSNRDTTSSIVPLTIGTVVGLTNGLIEPEWFKVTHGIGLVQSLKLPDPEELAIQASASDHRITNGEPSDLLKQTISPLMAILNDREHPPHAEGTSVYDRCGILAPIFVDPVNVSRSASSPLEYGTRCSIIILVDQQNRVTFYERALDIETRQWQDRVFHFTAQP